MVPFDLGVSDYLVVVWVLGVVGPLIGIYIKFRLYSRRRLKSDIMILDYLEKEHTHYEQVEERVENQIKRIYGKKKKPRIIKPIEYLDSRPFLYLFLAVIFTTLIYVIEYLYFQNIINIGARVYSGVVGILFILILVCLLRFGFKGADYILKKWGFK